MIMLFELGLIVGLLAVASNPSPYYAALGLVGSAGAGCLILMDGGVSFLCLVLFLVYLGGMMVVFAYSAALVAEPYPEAWGGGVVWSYITAYVLLLGAWWVIGGVDEGIAGVANMGVYVGDWFGVATMFFWGGGVLMVVGWALLLTLFAVLEVVRGHYSGVLRAV
uniref:NADH-ubiquinone oxidoreductase chain 6 n=1 Tax=Rhinella marina TaxID=8386 RepID=A0A8K1M7Z6_RHIMB|nr:NADH dehydrogenase subunit 6 [Rhinella marina]UBQ34085.1 NADH dehydrogenase subunit 6 [Rhinella marina]UVN16285.1 NADH dehydrogenase subunit 6 [Rhinella marina]